eukprot:1953873-Rhodomonas_salina.2
MQRRQTAERTRVRALHRAVVAEGLDGLLQAPHRLLYLCARAAVVRRSGVRHALLASLHRRHGVQALVEEHKGVLVLGLLLHAERLGLEVDPPEALVGDLVLLEQRHRLVVQLVPLPARPVPDQTPVVPVARLPFVYNHAHEPIRQRSLLRRHLAYQRRWLVVAARRMMAVRREIQGHGEREIVVQLDVGGAL